MPKKQKINILWFTKDLRTRDSESLYNVMQEDLPFLAVFVFDSDLFAQKQFGFRKIGKYRARFLLESIEDLKQRLAKKNIPLLVRQNKTENVFEEIAKEFEIVKIFCQQEWTKEETDLQTKIRKTVPYAFWEKSYSQFLLHPFFVCKVFDKIPDLFTTFRNKIEKNLLIRPEFETEQLICYKSEIHFESDKITLRSLGLKILTQMQEVLFPFREEKLKA